MLIEAELVKQINQYLYSSRKCDDFDRLVRSDGFA